MLWTILVILLILAILGSPTVGWAPQGWGWGPSGLVSLILVILLIWLLLGHRIR